MAPLPSRIRNSIMIWWPIALCWYLDISAIESWQVCQTLSPEISVFTNFELPSGTVNEWWYGEIHWHTQTLFKTLDHRIGVNGDRRESVGPYWLPTKKQGAKAELKRSLRKGPATTNRIWSKKPKAPCVSECQHESGKISAKPFQANFWFAETSGLGCKCGSR